MCILKFFTVRCLTIVVFHHQLLLLLSENINLPTANCSSECVLDSSNGKCLNSLCIENTQREVDLCPSKFYLCADTHQCLPLCGFIVIDVNVSYSIIYDYFIVIFSLDSCSNFECNC